MHHNQGSPHNISAHLLQFDLLRFERPKHACVEFYTATILAFSNPLEDTRSLSVSRENSALVPSCRPLESIESILIIVFVTYAGTLIRLAAHGRSCFLRKLLSHCAYTRP